MNPLFRMLRSILSPIADPQWKQKIDQRRFLTCLTPVAFVPMPADGPLTLAGHLLAPIQFHGDGSVRVCDEIFHKSTNFKMPLPNNMAISRAGEILTISENKIPQHILTYEEGGWLQWGYKQPTLRDALTAEFRLNRELGARTVFAVFIFSLFAFVGLFVIAFLLSYFGFN